MRLNRRAALLRRAVGDWHDRGIIDARTAKALDDDIGPDTGGATFTGFMVVAGIVCLAAAAITFVAANWDGIPRLARLAMILGSLWGAWAACAWAHVRGAHWVADALAFLASALLGAAIMLVAQLYQIQGRPEDALLTWAVGAFLAALLVRYAMPLVLAAILFSIWHGWRVFDADLGLVNPGYLAALAACLVAARLMHSRLTAHVVMLGLIGWIGQVVLTVGAPEANVPVAAAGGIAVMAGLIALHGHRRSPLAGFEAAAMSYAALFSGGAVAVLYVAVAADAESLVLSPLAAVAISAALLFAGLAWRAGHHANEAASAAGMAVAALAVFGLGVRPVIVGEAYLVGFPLWLIWLSGRLGLPSLRRDGILGFALAVLMVYAVTVGSLIGTSTFYLGFGVILLVFAGLAVRLRRAREARNEARE